MKRLIKVSMSSLLIFLIVMVFVGCKDNGMTKSITDGKTDSNSSSYELLSVKARVKEEFIDPLLPIGDKSNELYGLYSDGTITEEEYDSRCEPLIAKMEKIMDSVRPDSIEEKVKVAMAKDQDDVLTFDEVMALWFKADSFNNGLENLFKVHHKIHQQYEKGLITKEEANKLIEELDKKSKDAHNKSKLYLSRIETYLTVKGKVINDSEMTREEIDRSVKNILDNLEPKDVVGRKIK